jgi:hypothetical protein
MQNVAEPGGSLRQIALAMDEFGGDLAHDGAGLLIGEEDAQRAGEAVGSSPPRPCCTTAGTPWVSQATTGTPLACASR